MVVIENKIDKHIHRDYSFIIYDKENDETTEYPSMVDLRINGELTYCDPIIKKGI